MLIALVVLLAFVSPTARQLAAVVGGIGLGLFIDELGKFITADNNYFFKPTAAIIYCFFVGAFIGLRQLDQRRYTKQEDVVNVIEMLKEAALGMILFLAVRTILGHELEHETAGRPALVPSRAGL